MAKEPGLSLLDLAAMSEDVPVGGDNFIKVTGISTEKALDILGRFPLLAKMSQGFKLSDLAVAAPGALSAILASGTGKHGDVEAETAAKNIPIEMQFDIVEAIGRLTFKNGFAPFVQRLMALASAVKSDLYSRVPSLNSQATSKPSSPPDTAPVMSGDTPPAK